MPKQTAKTTAETPRAAKRARRPAAADARARQAPRRRGGTPVTHEQIARRAYEIHLSGDGGDAVEHWLRAERELATA